MVRVQGYNLNYLHLYAIIININIICNYLIFQLLMNGLRVPTSGQGVRL